MESVVEQKPVGQAVAIALSVFVGVTAIFSAIMALGIAPLHMREIGISGDPHVPNNGARWLTYILSVVFLLNAMLAVRVGRKALRPALLITALFVVANAILGVLYLSTW